MDYSQYYQKWLGEEFPEDRIPSYYEILGLMEAEPNLKSISNAVDLALTRLQEMENDSDAYAFLARQILKARQILTDPALKFEYDTQILHGNGNLVWKSHRRAGWGDRIRQFGLITIALLMGMVVMCMMALTVKRNPDGSIIFREEVKVQTALPFTTPLDGLVCRPAFASDFRDGGYFVDIRGQSNGITATPETEVASSVNDSENAVHSQVAKSGNTDSETFENEFDALIPDDMTNVGSVKNEQENDEWAALLPEGTEIEKAVSEETFSVSKKQNVRLRSPLYGRAAENRKVSGDGGEENEAESLSISKNTEEDLPGDSVNSTALQAADENVSSEKASQSAVAVDGTKNAFSPRMILEFLSRAHEKINRDDQKAEALFAIVQGQAYLEIMKKAEEKSLVLEPDFLKEIMPRVLKTAEELGWEKHFEEAFQLCVLLRELGLNNGLTDEDLAVVDVKKATLQKHQARYLKALEFKSILEKNPEDPEANVGYAMWLWSESDVEGSVPYLAKARQASINRAAQFELKRRADLDDNEYFITTGDLWWELSMKLDDKRKKDLVKEHARKFYRKADPVLLSDEQKLRLNDSVEMSQK